MKVPARKGPARTKPVPDRMPISEAEAVLRHPGPPAQKPAVPVVQDRTAARLPVAGPPPREAHAGDPPVTGR